MRVFECVPNVSEGRNRATLDACAAAITGAGVVLAHRTSDPVHDRSVFTFFGSGEAVVAAVVALAGVTTESIDLRTQRGAHPRIGALDVVLDARPEVLAHNLETVRRLTPTVRDKRATFDQSLAVLAHAKASATTRYTKTSLMLGLGEREDEIEATMDEARAVGVDIFTMGQYLQPTKRHLDVVEFVTPAKFERLRDLGVAKGFRQVVSSPLSRSSYHAEQAFAD
ncbi:MAG: hypothetical protein NVS1B2_20680 [Vulcanimicrobiaceae bacterium]